MDPEQQLVEHAHRFAASGATAVEPRLAATVVLLRPPLRVYLIRRVRTMAFAAGMYVFPGGTVDPRDTDVDWVAPAHRLGLPDAQARAVACAAVREVFEETGVLLAGRAGVHGGDADDVLPDVSTPDWEEARRAVEAREVGFADLLRGRGLVLRADLLVPWSRWITPEFEPRRYDTFFFLARLPLGQRTREVGGEASHATWVTPGEADLPMLPPTRVTLRQLAAAGSVEGAVAAAADRDVATPVTPRVVDGRLVY